MYLLEVRKARIKQIKQADDKKSSGKGHQHVRHYGLQIKCN